MNNRYRLIQVMNYCKDQLNDAYGAKEDEKDIGVWIYAWEEIEILVNSTINDLCNMHRFQAAKELEDCRDMVKIALTLGGFYNEKISS